MKLIVGLGNPEPQYSQTRHNVGKDIVNLLKESEYPSESWKGAFKINAEVIKVPQDAIIAKPLCFMNEVGSVVSQLLHAYKVEMEDLMIIYDELDLTVGDFKLNQSKGSRIHNGIRSIHDHLGSSNYWHLRVGVRDESIPMSVQKTGRDPAKYVLEKFSLQDSEKVKNLSLNFIIPQLNSFLSKN